MGREIQYFLQMDIPVVISPLVAWEHKYTMMEAWGNQPM